MRTEHDPTRVRAGGDEVLLSRFLAGDPIAREEFPSAFGCQLRRMARQHAKELRTSELIEARDVEHEAILLLIGRDPNRFQPSRGSAGAFLRLEIRDAVKAVRAGVRPPGTRARDLSADPPVSLHKPVERGSDLVLGDAVPDDQEPFDIAVERLDLVEYVLKQADEDTASALRLFLKGEADTVTEAARLAGMSRFTLRRRLDELAAKVALAA